MSMLYQSVCLSVCLCVCTYVCLSYRKAPAPFDTEKMHSDFKMKDFPNQVFAKNQPFFYQTEGKPILLARVTGLEGAWLACTVAQVCVCVVRQC